METDEHGRHWDTLCVSIMALATAMMAGLLVFLRFPVLKAGADWEYSTPATIVIVGVILAGVLYVGCIWWGMSTLANRNKLGKYLAFGYLRLFVMALVFLVLAVIIAGIFTHIVAEPATDEPQGSGGFESTPALVCTMR